MNLDLPEKPETKQAPAAAEDRARQGDDSRPYCEVHQCLMVASGSGPDITYYKCPVKKCKCKEKRVRPQFKMSAAPKECPQSTCREPQQYLEADLKHKQGAATITMICPKCGFKIQQPRPQFRPRESRDEQLGER